VNMGEIPMDEFKQSHYSTGHQGQETHKQACVISRWQTCFCIRNNATILNWLTINKGNNALQQKSFEWEILTYNYNVTHADNDLNSSL
jgi:hypothetical protein